MDQFAGRTGISLNRSFLVRNFLQWTTNVGVQRQALSQALLNCKVFTAKLEDYITMNNKALRHVENVFIQGFLSIHPRFVFIVQAR